MKRKRKVTEGCTAVSTVTSLNVCSYFSILYPVNKIDVSKIYIIMEYMITVDNLK